MNPLLQTEIYIQIYMESNQVNELESLNRTLQNSNQDLSSSVSLMEKEMAEKRKEAEQMYYLLVWIFENLILKNLSFDVYRDAKLDQLEETISRLKSERAELMLTIEKGEGSSTIIHQLQQENVYFLLLFLIFLYNKKVSNY